MGGGGLVPVLSKVKEKTSKQLGATLLASCKERSVFFRDLCVEMEAQTFSVSRSPPKKKCV
jgi:hypothetical protein